MKRIWVFIIGIVTGIVLMIVISLIAVKCSNNGSMVLFEEAGDCVGSKFKVFQVLASGEALASEIEEGYRSTLGATVLFLNEGQAYYDDQVIDIPYGKCARQVGIYKYKTKAGHEATVPVVVMR